MHCSKVLGSICNVPKIYETITLIVSFYVIYLSSSKSEQILLTQRLLFGENTLESFVPLRMLNTICTMRSLLAGYDFTINALILKYFAGIDLPLASVNTPIQNPKVFTIYLSAAPKGSSDMSNFCKSSKDSLIILVNN